MEERSRYWGLDVGTSVNPTHRSIRIRFDSYGDGQTAKYACAT